MQVHPAAAAGYQASSDAYERGRPAYPGEAVAYLVGALDLREGKGVLDLGAGTGKLTTLLAPSGARLLAVEPVQAMREKLAAKLPEAAVFEGTAEAIPLQAGAVDAVVVAQAFHWFDGPKALAEIHRVLRPGGRLGLIWNVRDESVDWVAQLTALIDPHASGAPRYRTGNWRQAFDATLLFTPLVLRQFRHVQLGPPEQVADRLASISFIAALPAKTRERVLAKVRHLLESHPDTRGSPELGLPYRVDAFACVRRP